MENGMNQTAKKFNLKDFLINYALYALIILLIIVYASLTPLFLSLDNIKALIANSSPLLVYAVGMTFVLMLGEIDLSVGSIGAVAASAWLLPVVNSNLSLPIAFLLAICVGALLGAFNGFLIVGLKINAFLATLGTQFLLRGIVYICTGGSQILTNKAIKQLISPKVFGGISPIIIISLLLGVVMMLMYKYTSFGRKVQAVGCNSKAANQVGINSNRIRFIVFIICGACAGLAGTLQVMNVGMLNPSNIGDGMEFLAITACVLGGTSLFGGVGTIVPGTLIGVIFLMSIENGLGLLGVNAYAYPVVRGIVIFLAMFSDSLKRSIGKK